MSPSVCFVSVYCSTTVHKGTLAFTSRCTVERHMHETSVGKVLCHWMNYTGVSKLSLSHTFSSGMEHDVQERWQLWPTMGSVELVSPIMPRLEVWSKKWAGQAFLCFLTDCYLKCFIMQCQWEVNQWMGDPEHATSVHRSDQPNYMKIKPPLDRVRYL